MKKLLSIFVAISILICPVYAEVSEIDEIISDTAGYLFDAVTKPQISSIGGEWAVLGLYKSGIAAPYDYFEEYYKNAEVLVAERQGVLSSRKYTEYARVVLALSVIGKTPENVAGYNLVTPLFDFDAVTRQGLNGSIWALIAIDSGDYGDSGIRDRYIQKILESELENGGWALGSGEEAADCDVTAMALTALANHRESAAVSEAVARGVDCLIGMQNDNGGFLTYGEETAESIAQVITAISTLGIDTDKFSKNGKTPIDALKRFYKKGEGFSHTIDGDSNLMATEQAFYALVAAKRYKEGKNSIFAADKFTDISGISAETAVLSLNKIGVINGMGGRIFAPDSSVTRAEFATMAVKALGITEDADCKFSDIQKSEWFYPYVSAAYKNGIVFGVSENEFNPYGKITCEEAAAMLTRAAKMLEIEADVKEYQAGGISEWAVYSYNYCVAVGILDAEKAPKKALDRAEIAQMIYNMLKKAEIL